MVMLALDGPYAGRRMNKVPDGYRAVMHFDNFPDVMSCHPDYDRHRFIVDVLEGAEEFTDTEAAIRIVNTMRDGMPNKVACHVIALMVKVNERIWELSRVKLQ